MIVLPVLVKLLEILEFSRNSKLISKYNVKLLLRMPFKFFADTARSISRQFMQTAFKCLSSPKTSCFHMHCVYAMHMRFLHSKGAYALCFHICTTRIQS